MLKPNFHRHCSALLCPKAPPLNDTRSFFSFLMRDPERLSQWLSNVQTAQNFIPTETKYLCERHFKSEDIRTLSQGAQSPDGFKKRLKPGAVPVCEWIESPPKLLPYDTDPIPADPSLNPLIDIQPMQKTSNLDLDELSVKLAQKDLMIKTLKRKCKVLKNQLRRLRDTKERMRSTALLRQQKLMKAHSKELARFRRRFTAEGLKKLAAGDAKYLVVDRTGSFHRLATA